MAYFFNSSLRMGNRRIRLPVAAKMALIFYKIPKVAQGVNKADTVFYVKMDCILGSFFIDTLTFHGLYSEWDTTNRQNFLEAMGYGL